MPNTFNDVTVLDAHASAHKATRPTPQSPRPSRNPSPWVKYGAALAGALLLLGALIFLLYKVYYIQNHPKELIEKHAPGYTLLAEQDSNLSQVVEQQRKQAQEKITELEEEQNKSDSRLKEALSKNLVTQAFTAQELDGFALWSKGRLAVTEEEGQKLLFEVNPETGRTHVSGALGVQGDALFSGQIESGGLTALGSVVGDSFSTGAFTVTNEGLLEAVSGTLQQATTQYLSSTDIEATTLTAGEVVANALEVDSLVTKSQLDAPEVRATKGSIASLEADELSSHALAADSAEVATLSSQQMVSPEAHIDSLTSTYAAAQEVEATAVSTAELVANSLQAATTSTEELYSDMVKAHEVDATFVSGTLRALSLTGENSGVVQFAPPIEGVTSRVQTAVLPTPADTLAVFTSVGYQDTDEAAQVGVVQEGEKFHLVCRFPEGTTISEPLQVIWLALVR